MGKTLTDRFKTKRGKELDLVSIAKTDRENYEKKLNNFYSGIKYDRRKYEDSLNDYSDGKILNSDKNYFGKLGKGFRRGVATLAAITGLAFMGCPGPTDPRPEPEPPIENPTEPTNPTNPTNPTEPVKPVEPIPDTDYVDISGRVQENEEDSNQQAEIEIYDSRTKNTDGSYAYSDFLGEVMTDSEGKFSITLNGKKIDASDKIYLRAKMIIPGYTRTLELPATDHNPITDVRANPAVRCVPVDGLGLGSLSVSGREEDFKEHAKRLNFSDTVYITPAPEPGSCYLKKGDSVKKTELSSKYFNSTHLQTIKNRVANSGLPNALEIANNIYLGDEHTANGREDLAEIGWGRILPKNHPTNTSGQSATIIYDLDENTGNIERFTSYLDTDYLDDPTTTHEIPGHKYFPGHADNDIEGNEEFPSHMTYSSNNRTSTFSSADIKTIYIVDEPTYLGMESIEDILG